MLSHVNGTGLRARVTELGSHLNTQTLVVGVAAVAVTPIIFPLVKPALKATIKAGVTLYEKVKITIAETGESIADIAAEARSEVYASSQPVSPSNTNLPSTEVSAET